MTTNFNIFLLVTFVDAAISANRHHCLPGQEAERNSTTGLHYCIDCLPTKTYSRDGKRCKLCSICHQGQTEVRRCSKTSDTMCRCAKGTYLKGGAICKTCSICPKGMIQTHECEYNMDRTCRRCPDGFTTNSSNDRVCVPVKVKAPPPRSPNVIIRHIVDWWIFLCIPAVVVLVGSCAAVYYWRIRKKKKNTPTKTSLVKKAEVYELEEQSSYPEQVHFVPTEETCSHGNYRMVRELPAHLYEELGLKLNSRHPRNWVYLAGMLGFSRDQIRYLELQPRDSTQNLINDWSSKSNSTVYNLYVALTNMNRIDAAKVVENYVYR